MWCIHKEFLFPLFVPCWFANGLCILICRQSIYVDIWIDKNCAHVSTHTTKPCSLWPRSCVPMTEFICVTVCRAWQYAGRDSLAAFFAYASFYILVHFFVMDFGVCLVFIIKTKLHDLHSLIAYGYGRHCILSMQYLTDRQPTMSWIPTWKSAPFFRMAGTLLYNNVNQNYTPMLSESQYRILGIFETWREKHSLMMRHWSRASNPFQIQMPQTPWYLREEHWCSASNPFLIHSRASNFVWSRCHKHLGTPEKNTVWSRASIPSHQHCHRMMRKCYCMIAL